MKKTALIVFLLLLGHSVTRALVLHVPSDFPSIQAGIEAAADGDTVLVAPGTYIGDGYHDIDFLGKAILVTSEMGPDSTTIMYGSYGFIFQSGETASSILRGFTIKNAYYAVYIEGSSPVIEDCHVYENGDMLMGDGVIRIFYGSSPVFYDCEIAYNRGQDYATIVSISSDPTFVNTLFFLNDSVFYPDIYFSGTMVLENCTFFPPLGMDGDYLVMRNSIFWNSVLPINVDSADITYSDIDGGWPGEGNIDEDPLFADPWNGDYELLPGSPCIDSGDPTTPVVPWGGWRRDMGALEYDRGFYWDGEDVVLKPFPLEIPLLR